MRNFIVRKVNNYFFYVDARLSVTSKKFQSCDVEFLQSFRKGTIFLYVGL